MACSIQLASFYTTLSSVSSSTSSSYSPLAIFLPNGRKINSGNKFGRKIKNYRFFRVMNVQQPVQGASATYAKEMERLSAKESLLLAVINFNLFIL